MKIEEAKNLTDDQLLVSLKEALGKAAEGLAEACVSALVLQDRGHDLSRLPEVFRYAEDIAYGRLSPSAAWPLARFPWAVKAILPLSLEEQDAIADGKKIKVAVRKDGRIMFDDLSIYSMSYSQISMVFSDEGITPASEQGEWLHKSDHAEVAKSSTKKVVVSYVIESQKLKINRGGELSVDDLIPALAALGYSVKPIYGSKGIVPAKGV